MKTTNNKHIINDKLQGVDLPDMEASWQKMEKSMDAAGGAQSGWSVFVSKYKIYLNLFIAVTTIGLVGLLVKSKTIRSNFEPESDISLAGESPYKLNYLTFDADVNHDDDLPLLEGPLNAQKKSTIVEYSNLQTLFSPSENSDTISNSVPTTTEHKVADKDSVIEPELVVKTITLDEDFLGRKAFEPTVYVHNQVGVKIQSGVLPEISVNNAVQTTGFAVFARRYVQPKGAIHIEIGYNPIAIRPITYVAKYNVFNNVNYTQTDSAIVKRLRYVTIPINWHYQVRPGFSISGGPQVSFLTGLAGDMTRKLAYPNAPETDSEAQDITIKNRGGFKTSDIGINFGCSWHTGRFELGAQVQTGLSDYTNETLSTQTHRISTLQIKATCLLGE